MTQTPQHYFCWNKRSIFGEQQFNEYFVDSAVNPVYLGTSNIFQNRMRLKIFKPDDSQNKNRYQNVTFLSNRLCIISQKNNVLRDKTFFFFFFLYQHE